MAEVAFLGLGVMGYPMAGHLKARGGHQLHVYNRTKAKAERWTAEHGGIAAASPSEAAEGCDFVFACVGNDDDLRAIALAPDGAIAGMKPGAIFIDNTTASAHVARELHEAAAARPGRSSRRCGSPSPRTSGSVSGLRVRRNSDIASSYARAEPVIAAYARACRLMGGPGAGQLTKMVNQICIAGLVQGLAEGLHFAEKAGLDAASVVDVISKGAAQSWQMDNRYKTMIAREFEFGFAVDWMRKDLAICLDEARRNGAHLPATALVDQFYSQVQKMGGGRWDSSSLIALLLK